MGDRWGPDPTSELWERWRRPVLTLVAVVFVVGQWDRLTSGEPFVIATGIGVAGFWVSVVCTPSRPPLDERTSAEAWRRHARRAAIIYGSWTVAACVWLGVAAVLYSISPINLVVPAIPAVLTVLQWWTHHRASWMAEMEERAAT